MHSSDCTNYLGYMSKDMTQMVIAISNWGGDFDWLEHGVCEGTCSATDTFSSIKNLAFMTTNVEAADFESNDTTEYTYGGDCSSLTDEYCGSISNCQKCSWSWPSDDPA